jgi:glycerate dehydrogenase
LGYGKTGQFVARFAESFGFAIRHTNSQTHLEEVEEILSTSDIVTMHMALNAQTRAFLNARRLQLLKKDVIIINTSRGALIDEPALAQFCSDHSRAIAFLDVLSIEPPASDNPLRRLKNVHLTPHTGWNSEESDEYLAGATYAALERMLLASS